MDIPFILPPMLPACHPAQMHYKGIVTPSLTDNFTLLLAYMLRGGTTKASLDAEDRAISLLEEELYEIQQDNYNRLSSLNSSNATIEQLLPVAPSSISTVLTFTEFSPMGRNGSQIIQNDYQIRHTDTDHFYNGSHSTHAIYGSSDSYGHHNNFWTSKLSSNHQHLQPCFTTQAFTATEDWYSPHHHPPDSIRNHRNQGN